MEKFRNTPGWVIFMAFIFAWPLGFALLFLKFSSKANEAYDKLNVSSNGVTISENKVFKTEKLKKMKSKRGKFKVISIICFIIALIFFVALMTDISSDGIDDISGGIIVNVIAFAIFIPVFITYFKTYILIKKIEAYQNLILIRDIYNTDKLAKYLKCKKSEVLDFVTYMIREGFLELDIEDDNIIQPKEYVDPAQIFSIICQSCGATNKYIKGKNNKCEYCGTVLNLNKI